MRVLCSLGRYVLLLSLSGPGDFALRVPVAPEAFIFAVGNNILVAGFICVVSLNRMNSDCRPGKSKGRISQCCYTTSAL